MYLGFKTKPKPLFVLKFDMQNYTLVECSPELVSEIEQENCKDVQYASTTGNLYALEHSYGEFRTNKNLSFSLLYSWCNPENSVTYGITRVSDGITVGYIQISSLFDETPFMFIGIRYSVCDLYDIAQFFVYAVSPLLKHGYYKGINYICNANDRLSCSLIKDCAGIPVYAVDLNAGPKLNVYYLPHQQL